jgi:ankyrin repeat protein
VVKLLLNKGADINAQGGFYGNALQAASFRGHNQVMKMLRDEGAVDGRGRKAVNAASIPGHEQAVELLLDKRKQRPKPWRNVFRRFGR